MVNFCPRLPRFVTGRQAKRDIAKNDGRIKVVQYYSPNCGHCREADPKIEALQRQFCSEIDVLKVSVDQNPDIADSAKVKYLPTVAVYHNGERITQTVGDQEPEKFAKLVKRAMRKVEKGKK